MIEQKATEETEKEQKETGTAVCVASCWSREGRSGLPRLRAIACVWMALLSLGGLRALADTVFLRSGERVTGRIVSESGKQIVFESEGLGRLKIPLERIDKIERSRPVVSTPGFVRPSIPTPAPVPGTNGTSKSTWLTWLGGWLPVARTEHTNDWIQLKSGEWLRGSIKAMQDRKLEFDSEELEQLTFDWKDIRELHSPRWNDIWFASEERISGPIDITPETVTVGGESPLTFPRSELVGITPGGTLELDHWSGKVSVGLTLRSGNTESFEYNAQASLRRRTPGTRLKLDYLGNISEFDAVENANNHRVTAEFDYWITRRFFLLLPYLEYFRDRFQNLDHRLTGGVGVGYDIIDRSKLEWNITAGPAYQHSWFHSVEPGEQDDRGAVALVFGSLFDWEITRRIDLIAEYRGQFTRREIGETAHHSVLTLAVELSRSLDLDVSFVWDRITYPKTDANGVTPEPDDFRLIAGLGLNF